MYSNTINYRYGQLLSDYKIPKRQTSDPYSFVLSHGVRNRMRENDNRANSIFQYYALLPCFSRCKSMIYIHRRYNPVDAKVSACYSHAEFQTAMRHNTQRLTPSMYVKFNGFIN